MAAKGWCFFCKAESDVFADGWQLRDGSLAQLCIKCGLAYVNGLFCETFHMEVEGWRGCAVCGKPLHCGCIMSCRKYAPLDFGGVGCSNCLVEVDRSIASGQMTRMLKEIGAKYKVNPTNSSDPTKKVDDSRSPGSLLARTQFREESNMDASKRDTACETKVDSETPQVDASRGNHLHPYNLQKTSIAEQHQKVSGNLISYSITVFEKSSTVSDANCSTGCLVISKNYAAESSPRDIETGPTSLDTSLKADQEQSSMDMVTSTMTMETNQKTNQEQSPRYSDGCRYKFEKRPGTISKEFGSRMPVEASQRSDQIIASFRGQAPREIETGPMPVGTTLKSENRKNLKGMWKQVQHLRKNLKADQVVHL